MDDDFTADPVELFFDLAFVFAFSQLVSVLVHDTSGTSVAKSGLLFVLLWFAWSQFTWSANGVGSSNRSVRATFLIATVAAVPLAAAITTAYDTGGKMFAWAYVAIRLMANAIYVIGARDREVRRSAVQYTIIANTASVLVVVGAYLGDRAQIALWLVAFAIDVAAALAAGSGTWIIRAGHFAERHGLIIIVALGEVIVAIGIAVNESIEEAASIPASTATALVGAGLFAVMLWWAYFDTVQPAAESGLSRAEGAARGRFARDVFTFFHAPIVAGVVLAAAAIEHIALHPDEALPRDFRIMLAVGVALYLGGFIIGAYRAIHLIRYERLVVTAIVALVLATQTSWSGLTQLLVIDALLFAMLVVEHVREPVPAALTGASDPRASDITG